MKRNSYLFFLLLFLLASCKSNQEAYNTTYQKLKEKEEAMMDAKAKTAMDVPKSATSKDSTNKYLSEKFNLILGDEQNISVYSIVTKSFINKTNAKSYFSRMEENGYPAALIQNEDLMFRIVVASFSTKIEAENKLKEINKDYPDAIILKRMKY
jgi:hypothetical protein